MTGRQIAARMNDGQYVSLVLLASISLIAIGGRTVSAMWLPLGSGNCDTTVTARMSGPSTTNHSEMALALQSHTWGEALAVPFQL